MSKFERAYNAICVAAECDDPTRHPWYGMTISQVNSRLLELCELVTKGQVETFDSEDASFFSRFGFKIQEPCFDSVNYKIFA